MIRIEAGSVEQIRRNQLATGSHSMRVRADALGKSGIRPPARWGEQLGATIGAVAVPRVQLRYAQCPDHVRL